MFSKCGLLLRIRHPITNSGLTLVDELDRRDSHPEEDALHILLQSKGYGQSIENPAHRQQIVSARQDVSCQEMCCWKQSC